MSVLLEQTNMDMRKSEKSGLHFPDLLTQWADFIKREQRKVQKLVEMSVTIRRRDRGLTISDQYGGYGTRPTTEGRWLDYDSDLDGEVHPINIVHDAIATNKNACLQSNSVTEVTSANESAKHKQIAQRWQRVCNYLERVTWDEAARGFIFDGTQKDGTDLVYSYLEECDKQAVPSVNQKKSGMAVYSCDSCGSKGVSQSDAPEIVGDNSDTDDAPQFAMGEVPCPQCGGQASAMIHSLAGFEMGENEVATYKIKKEIVPFFNFTADTYGAKIGGIQTMTWLQIQRLKSRPALETQYPNANFSGTYRWSYPLCCDYALANGDWGYLNGWNRSSNFDEFSYSEERTIYLHEDAYSNYKAPQDWEFVNRDGKKTFAINAGQTIGDALTSIYGENPKGFKFIWCDEVLIDICDGEDEELNLRECFSDVHWSRESTSYLSSPHYSVVTIQDAITLLNTMDFNIIARNSVNPVYYNSRIFEQADFSKEFIGTKNEALLDEDLRQSVVSLPIPTPSPHLNEKLAFLFEIKDTVTTVTPAMRGESQKGEPYAAQRQQLETSYGGLTSVLKSFAQCKCTVFVQQAKLAKKKWTLEQFQRVGSMFGEVWTEEDVQEMCDIDFDEDLAVSYRAGSEMPQSNLSKEMKFFGGLQQLIPFLAQFQQLIPANKMREIMEKIGETMDMDMDITDMEEDERIFQKRAIDLAEICRPFQNLTLDQVEAMKMKIVAMQPPDLQAVQQSIQLAQSAPQDPQAMQQAQQMASPKPIYQLDTILEQVFHMSQIRFDKYEDLNGQQGFFIQQLKAEKGKTKSNFVLLTVLSQLLEMLQQAIDQQKQQAMQNDPQMQMAMAEQENQKADRQIAAAKVQVEGAKIQSQNAQMEADRQHQKEVEQAKIVHSLIEQGADQQHEAMLQPTMKEQIVTAIKYESLPPVAQKDLLSEIGVNVSVAELKQTAKDNKPVPATKPAAKK